ncbi:MAG TPA: copper amine oxidase N-terminal domain-containing protein, partial [Armatimonadota bacterium]
MSRGWWVLVVLWLGTWAGAVAPVRISVAAPDVLVFGTVEMVPLTPLAEIWGAQLTADKGAVTFTRGQQTFTCTPGKRAARANGTAVTLPLAPFQRVGVTYVPLRALVAALGGTVVQPQGQHPLTAIVPSLAPLYLPRTGFMGTPQQYQDVDGELY